MRALRPGGLAVAVLMVATLAACAGSTGATDPEVVPTELSRALPAAETAAPSPSSSPVGKCDDDASYDPLPELPKSFPAGSTLAKIRERGRLIVGTAGDKRLLSVRDPKDGELRGIDIDIARAMAKAILGNDQAIEFRTIPYGQREQVLITGQVDLVAHSMTMTCDRWQRVGFSAEYYRDGQRLLVRTDSKIKEVQELAAAGGSVCVARGTTTIDKLRQLKVTNIVPVDDAADCLAYFQRDEVDAITSNVLILAGYQLQDPYAQIVGKRLSNEPIALGFRKEDVYFIRYANAVLARMRQDGSLEEIFTQRMRETGEEPDLGEPHYGRAEG